MRGKCWKVVCLSVLLAVNSVSGSLPSDVPAQFQDLYSALESKLEAFDQRLGNRGDARGSAVYFSAELMTANSARGVELLEPGTRKGVHLELDRLQSLGVRAVTVSVSFPIVYEPFLKWNGNPAVNAQAFLSFYKELAQEIHKRGLKMIAKTGPMFAGAYTSGSGFKIAEYYASLREPEYYTGRALVALAIAKEIQPDYLSIAAEPDIEEHVSHKHAGASVRGYATFVKRTVDLLRSQGAGRVPVGAGVGTWQKKGQEYVRELCGTGVTYIDLHVYPINGGSLDKLIDYASLAESKGKRVAIGESWMTKQRDSEMASDLASNPGIFARDAFSFWAPLDQKFLSEMVKFSAARHLLFFSPFWTKYFYAYLDYRKVGEMAPAKIMAQSTAATASALVQGVFSETGQYYQRLISQK